MIRSRISSALSVAAALLLLAGCSTGACYDNQNSLPKAGFYSSETGKQVSVSGLSVGGFNAPNDSLLCRPSQTVTSVYLPFRPKETSTRFAFKVGMFSDVITFNYQSIPYFASADCGAMWRFRITSVTWSGTVVDSVAVVDSLITNVDSEQLKIFLAPVSSDDEEDDETNDEGTAEEPAE